MNQLPFFVYGTLKPGGINYQRFFDGQTHAETPAKLPLSALFYDQNLPFLVVGEPWANKDDHVFGYLIAVKPEFYHTVLKQVDALEGYRTGSLNNWYVRQRVLVLNEGRQEAAWAYTAGHRILARIRAGQFTRSTSGAWPP